MAEISQPLDTFSQQKLEKLATLTVNRIERYGTCEHLLAWVVHPTFRVAWNGERGVSCLPRRKLRPKVHHPRSCAHQKGASSPNHKSPLHQGDKNISKNKVKKLWSFSLLLHYKNAKMECVCGAVAEGASVWNQISIKRNPRRRKKTSSPLCAGSKTNIMPLTKKSPAVARLTYDSTGWAMTVSGVMWFAKL